MRSRVALVIVFCYATASLAGEPVDRGAKSFVPSGMRSQSLSASRTSWDVHRSDNFRVCTTRGTAETVSQLCESLRAQYRKIWLGETAPESWTPRCEVVIHPTSASYMSFVGRSGSNSSGCSTIKIEHGQIVSRRIDVRADVADLMQTALPHELTHVVLADAFLHQSLPRWADEGIAVLVDPHDKQHGRQYDLHTALAHRRTFRLAEILTLDDYPAESRLGVFYSQSGSLVEFLVQRGTPADFVRFVQQASGEGYDTALRSTYKINGVADLERQWLSSVGGSRPNRASPFPGLARSDDAGRRPSVARMSRSN